MSQVSKEKSIPAKLPVVEPVQETTFGDRLLESLKPHASLIMLSVAALFLLFVAVAFMIQSRQSVSEGEWLSFNAQMTNLQLTGNTSGMKELAEDYPDGTAGLWGLQLAGNFELEQGLRKLGENRSDGLKDIEKATNTLKRVVEAPASKKSTLLQVRSTYTLAYAYESLGDFEKAKALYQQLVDNAPESAFGQAAQRGLARCTNPAFGQVYQKFKTWEDPFAIAPSAPTTEKPDISFPEVPANKGGAEQPKEDSKDKDAEAKSGDSTSNTTQPEGTQPAKAAESEVKPAGDAPAEPSVDVPAAEKKETAGEVPADNSSADKKD